LAVIAGVTVPFTGRGHSFPFVPGAPENWSAFYYARSRSHWFPGLLGFSQFWCCLWSWMESFKCWHPTKATIAGDF